MYTRMASRLDLVHNMSSSDVGYLGKIKNKARIYAQAVDRTDVWT